MVRNTSHQARSIVKDFTGQDEEDLMFIADQNSRCLAAAMRQGRIVQHRLPVEAAAAAEAETAIGLFAQALLNHRKLLSST